MLTGDHFLAVWVWSNCVGPSFFLYKMKTLPRGENGENCVRNTQFARFSFVENLGRLCIPLKKLT